MNWFNYYGLVIVAIILIPNIIFAIRHREAFENSYKNKAVEVLEQIGRYGCMLFMIFNIPYTWFGFYFESGKLVYLIVNAILCFAYVLTWIVTWNKSGVVKALLLSVLPSVIFLFSGIIIASIPLIVFAVIFSVFHITLSLKNAKVA